MSLLKQLKPSLKWNRQLKLSPVLCRAQWSHLQIQQKQHLHYSHHSLQEKLPNIPQSRKALPSPPDFSKPIPKSHALQTRESLLLLANSPWERFAIHLKWFLIKGYRPFNADEITTFFSWIILSHIIWIILGTTTFFSLLFYGLNTVFAKELVGKFTGKLITYLTPGFNIKFEDAVVPEWKNGMIDFKKVVVKTNDELGGKENSVKIDLKIDSLKLTLSFKKWKNAFGFIENVEINGMKGVIDRSHMDLNKPEMDIVDNKNYEIESLKIRDSRLKIIQNDGFDPLNISIYDCDIPRIRIKWLFLDFWNASSITGSMNGSLFTIHKRKHKLAYVNDIDNDSNPWKRLTRFQLDQINIDDLGLKDTHFNWLLDGKIEVTADIMPPDVDTHKLPYSSRYVVVDFKIQFSDLKASIPSELPSLSNGEPIISFDQLRPLIAYVNDKRIEQTEQTQSPTLNPIQFRIVKKLSDLENVTTLRESKILDVIATETYIDLLKQLHEYELEQRNKRIAMWSKTVASQLLIVGLGAMA